MTISLVGILLTLIVVGLVLYLVNVLPIDARIKTVAYVVVVLFLIIWLLQALVGVGPTIRLG